MQVSLNFFFISESGYKIVIGEQKKEGRGVEES